MTYGNTMGGFFGTAMKNAAAIVRGIVVAENVRNDMRYYDVLPDWGATTFTNCEVVGLPGDNAIFELQDRVLLAVLGPNVAVIIGGLQGRSSNNQAGTVDDPEPKTTPPQRRGPRDRVFAANGAEIVFTAQGDIVLRPARALRVDSPNIVRLGANSDASDGVVSAAAFLEFAAAVTAQLAHHELAHVALGVVGTGPNPAYVAHPTPATPTQATAICRGIAAPAPAPDGGE